VITQLGDDVTLSRPLSRSDHSVWLRQPGVVAATRTGGRQRV